ncbi:transcriptional regulator [Leptospira wolffii]|uniref:winged helix-turn-helix transcriptional regulator n=1 Tax=Leptospira wolffii TaxID=409998 RepID=UPI0002F30C9D|nr:helix-turn-helix domain-containing protein [Leptospira wolffii]EPG66889.1 transcriptional regulator, HxlR family [Leptospira wolffii serovar Khorat str. Khorat-H2]TGL55426.1 transcriptional regulator [Leptospira wolffii]
MKRKNLEQDSCPIARSLSTIGEWWSLLILRDVFLGKRRFSELEKSLGLAKNVLSSRLQKLVSEGVLEIVPASDGSAYQEYSLTEKGKGIFPILVAIRQWGEKFLFQDDPIDQALVEKKSGKKIKTIQVQSQAGKNLRPEDVRLLFFEKIKKPGKRN